MITEETQPKVNEKSQLKRRVMIFLAVVIALLIVMTAYFINLSFTPPRECPWTRLQCLTQPQITKFHIPRVPVCFDC